MDGLLAALVPLLGLVLDRAASTRSTGQVAGAIFRVITELARPFVVQGWTGDMAAGVEWAG